VSRKLAYFARELPKPVRCNVSFTSETIATYHLDGAFENEPDRGVPLAHVKNSLAGCEGPRSAACEALRGLNLSRIEHRE
jgi:hypothetical protein